MNVADFLKRDLLKIQLWCSTYRMTLNPSKPHSINISRYTVRHPFHFTHHYTVWTWPGYSCSFKFLLVTFYTQKTGFILNVIKLLAIIVQCSNFFMHLSCYALSSVPLFAVSYLKLLDCAPNKIQFFLLDALIKLKKIERLLVCYCFISIYIS